MKKRAIKIIIMVVFLFMVLGTVKISTNELENRTIHPRMVTYQYLTTCDECGSDLMEGYHSLVDGYTEELCRICGYYTVVEAFSDVKVVVHSSDLK